MQRCMTEDKLPTVQILLSTYNGERFLRPQLDSCLAQEGTRVKLLVRDDGSTDGTRAILAEYAARHGIEVHCGENLGVEGSLYALFPLRDRAADYYAISDQDDLWLPDKLARATAWLSTQEATSPRLFASVSRIIDGEGNEIGAMESPRRGAGFYNAMVQNAASGHAQVFNGALMDRLAAAYTPDILVMDWWNYLIATGLGEVYIDERAGVLHRQHGGNASGYELNPWRLFLIRTRRLLGGNSAALGRQLEAFRAIFGEQPAPEKRAEVDRFLACQEKGFFSRLGYALTCRCYRHKWWENWIFKALYTVGNYRTNERSAGGGKGAENP